MALKVFTARREFNKLDDVLINGAALLVPPDLARMLLAECPYKGQRLLNDDRALLLASLMEHGTFLPNTQIAFGRLNGRYHLVNGQHRLNGVELSQVPQSFRVEIYECANEAELDALYCRFDQPGGVRSITQVSRALGLHDDHKGGLRPATAALLLRAVPLLMVDLRRVAPVMRPRSTRDLDAKKEFALPWKPAAVEYQKCLDRGVTKYTGRFRSGGVVAAALATFRYQSERAEQFWYGAISADGLAALDPRATLRSDFMSRARVKIDLDLAEACAVAWNAFVQGRELKIIKVLGGSIKLIGTPYGGGE